MAKMHSSGKGRSGSVKPYVTAYPTWLTSSVEEIKADVIQMGNKGVAAPEIGAKLRDVYGVGKPKDVLGDRVTVFLEKNGVMPVVPFDLESLVMRANTLRSHLNVYKKDNSAKYRLILVSSRMYRLARYYKRKMKIPGNWKPKLVDYNK